VVRTHRRGGDQRGLAASAQLAVAFPLLLLITLGVIQAGVWLHGRNVAQRAAVAAVDVARGSYGTAADAEQRGRDIAAAGGLREVSVRVSRGPGGVTADVRARATLLLDLGLASLDETAAAPLERVSSTPG
jgi:Flp pilus assembly protein TadG